MELGPMQNFVYLVGDPVARECVVVDPAWEIDTIVETAERDGMRLVGALVTHTHQDHVGGSLESWGMPGRIPGVEDLLGAREGEGLRPQGRERVPPGLRLGPDGGRQPLDAGDRTPDADLHAHAGPHAGLPVLPDRR